VRKFAPCLVSKALFQIEGILKPLTLEKSLWVAPFEQLKMESPPSLFEVVAEVHFLALPLSSHPICV